MKKSAAAAAAVLVATSVLSGAAVMPGAATEDRSPHTKRFVLHETASHGLGDRTFAGTDKVRSRHSGQLVGFDTFTGKFYPRTNKVVIDTAFALRGGIIVGRLSIHGSDPHFDGPILKGTGNYKGIGGTIEGRLTNSRRTFLTLHYHL